MPHTLIAFSESISSGALENIAGVADPHVAVSGDDIFVPSYRFLSGFLFVGADMASARLAAPSLRGLLNIDCEEYDAAAEPASPPNFIDMFEIPLELDVNEGLNALVQDATSDAHRASCLVFLSSGPIKPVYGKVYTVLATAAATLVGYAWTNGALTFAQTLPARKYQIVGMRAESAGLIGARLVIPNWPWRPGCIGCDADGDVGHPRLRRGNSGVWGEFDARSPPTVDFLSISADTAERVWLDLIPL